MKIAFYAGSCIPIHARSVEERPLGGTETGLVRLAELLSARGHDVTVFTSMRNPPPSTPRYRFEREIMNERDLEVLVAVQTLDPVFFGLPCRRMFYWTGDGPEQYANFGLGDRRVARRLERVFAVSSWQRDALCRASGFPPEKVAIIGNGVHLPYFAGTEQRSRKRLLYTSAPYRGLELLPGIYTRLKARHPDAELAVFAGMQLYDREKPFEGPEKQLERRLQPIIAALPNCRSSEPVPQSRLAREYMRAAVLVYPNIINETCCMVALEAIAGGCPVVASAISALPETVGDCGAVIAGEPGSPGYLQLFEEQVDRILSDDGLWFRYRENCARRAERSLSWNTVADRFEEALRPL